MRNTESTAFGPEDLPPNLGGFVLVDDDKPAAEQTAAAAEDEGWDQSWWDNQSRIMAEQEARRAANEAEAAREAANPRPRGMGR